MSSASPELQPSQVTLKTVFTVALGVLLVAAVVAMLARSLVAVGLAGAALLIAITLEHPVRMLQRRGFKRSLAILTVMLSGLAIAVGFGFLLVPPAVRQGQQLVHNAPGFIETVRESKVFRAIDARLHVALRLQDLERQLPEEIEGAAAPILSAVGGILKVVGAVVTIVVLVVFMLVFGNPLIDAALAEARPERRSLYSSMLGKIYQSTGGYLAGLLLICLINASLTIGFLAINHVPFFLPLGILSVYPVWCRMPAPSPRAQRSRSSRCSRAVYGTGSPASFTSSCTARSKGTCSVPLIFRGERSTSTR